MGRKPGNGTWSEQHVQLTGQTRSYLRYRPAGGSANKLLVLLHGGGGNAERMLRMAEDFIPLADKHGVLLVYPNGMEKGWNDGRSDRALANRQKIDDTGFIRAIVSEAKNNSEILTVFVAGISNGGMMAQRLACEMSDELNGVVSVAANLPAELAPVCQPKPGISVMFINGVKDELVPYAGGEVKVFGRNRGKVLSTETSLAFWQRINSCEPRPEERMTAHAVRRDYNCQAGGLTLIRVENGGHAWPGGRQYLPEMVVGHATREFSAAEVIFRWLLAE
jgi:polyhydroxybutyrate depolymerase